MFARDGDDVRAALEGLECLVAIDAVQTDTVKLAQVTFAGLPAYAREGTFTTADRRVVKLNRAEGRTGDQRDTLEVLHALASAVASHTGKAASLPGPEAADVMAEVAAQVPGYAGARYDRIESGVTRAVLGDVSRAHLQAANLRAAPSASGKMVLTTARTLYTSLEGAATHSLEADKLHREEFLEINPADAMALGIGQNRPVVVRNGGREFTLSAALTDAVAPGSVFLPLYLDGGVVNALLHVADAEIPTVTVRPV